MRGGPLSTLRRLGWGVADQAVSSGSNFALTFAVARTVGVADFGAFSLAFAGYILLLGTTRAIASEPLLVRCSASTREESRRSSALATGTAIAIGTASGLVCLLIAWALSGPLAYLLVALGIGLPGLLLQDTWRFTFFAQRKGVLAFANDAVWAAVVFAAIGILMALGYTSPGWFMLAWGGSATAAAAVGFFQSKVIPRPGGAFEWMRRHRDLSPRFLGEFIATSGATKLSQYAIGAVTGLAAVGSIRAAELVTGGFLHVLFMSAPLVAIPEGVRLLQRSPARLRRASTLISLALAGAAAAWGAVAVLLPTGVGVALLGPTWRAADPVMLPLVLMKVAGGIVTGSQVGLRALAAAQRSLIARLLTIPVTVTASVGGAVNGGAAGAAVGFMVASGFGAVVWRWQFERALQEYRARGLDGADRTGSGPAPAELA